MNKNQKKNGRSSMHEIAAALQLSPATVSRVLNNHPHVHEATRNKVMMMIKEKGYKRNIMASGLRTNKTHTVGLIVPRISMFFHTEVITTIQNELHARGYNLIICQSNDQLDMEKDLVHTLYASRVDAVIVSCTLFTTHYGHFDLLNQINVPVIFYDRVPAGAYPACIVRGDDFRGAYLAVSHLLELGSKRIAFINGPLSCSIYMDRYAGFEKAMLLHRKPVIKEYVFYQELDEANARKALHKLFSKRPYPDAIFAANDLTALTALQFAKEAGIAVPRQLRIAGYSNDPRTAIASPSVTTIDQFPGHTGKMIVQELMKLLNGIVDQLPIITPVALIRRMST